MKTSIAALIAASLFLAAAYLGLGSGPATPPRSPQLISVGGSASEAGVPTVGDLPLTLPGTPDALAVGASQVLPVAHTVNQGTLKQLAASSGTTGGASDVALGPPSTSGDLTGNQQFSMNATIVPIPPTPGAAPPAAGGGGNPAPARTPVVQPTRFPRPDPTPAPVPVPTPTPTPTPSVTTTVTPTSTATPNSVVSPTPKP